MNHEMRKAVADERANPAFYFSYILELDDGGYYIGSTNAPAARFLEHSVGVGAKATSGKSFSVKMVFPFLSRREAAYNEKRLQEAYASAGPNAIRDFLAVVDHVSKIGRPEKTLTDLERERGEVETYLRKTFHYAVGNGIMPGAQLAAYCGWFDERVWGFYGTEDMESLVENERLYSVVLAATGDKRAALGATIYQKRSCKYCLAMEQAQL